jgi:hypothetical protein
LCFCAAFGGPRCAHASTRTVSSSSAPGTSTRIPSSRRIRRGLSTTPQTFTQQLEHDPFGIALLATVTRGEHTTVARGIRHVLSPFRAGWDGLRVIVIAAEIVDNLTGRADIAA